MLTPNDLWTEYRAMAMDRLRQQSYSEWLIVRCQMGNSEAFNNLVQLWHQRFLLYAINRIRDRDAAQDVTQECLLSISRSINKLDDPAAFPKWSFRILERRCVDWLRKTIRERERMCAQQTAAHQLRDAELEVVPANPLETNLTVAQLLGSLDPKLATLLRLYYLESLSVEEIAEINAVPVGTIKSRLYYARKLLGTLIDQ